MVPKRQTDVVQKYRDLVSVAQREPMLAECRKVLGHVYSTALNGSINWPWSGAMLNKVRAWEAKLLRFTFSSPNVSWRKLGKLQDKDRSMIAHQGKKVGLPLLTDNFETKFG